MSDSRNGVRRKGRVRYYRTNLWDVFDALPSPIRAALQEGPVQLSPMYIRTQLRRNRRWRDETEAVQRVVEIIAWAHDDVIHRAEDWQPPGHGRREPLPSPHLLVGATMQQSGRTL